MGLLDAGKLDRQITIQRRKKVRNTTFNTSEGGWELFAKASAQVSDLLPSRAMEESADGALQSRRRARVRIRWLPGLTSAMRVLCDGRTMQIIGPPAELGRRDGWEFLAEDYSTEGLPG